MQYLLLIQVPEANDDNRDVVEASGNDPAWASYTNALIEAGVMRGGNELAAPATATIVRMRDGRRDVQDGPFIETKEQLGGYYMIETATLDEALEWAARCPAAAYGAIEVRACMGG